MQNCLHMLTVSKSEAEILKHIKHRTRKVMDDSHTGCTQTSDSDPRTGTFPQTWPITGDTACEWGIGECCNTVLL